MGKHADSTDRKILWRIQSRNRCWVFTPDSFTDLGTRRAINLALMRHRDSGLIRQLARGSMTTRHLTHYAGTLDFIRDYSRKRQASRLLTKRVSTPSLIRCLHGIRQL